MRDAIAAMRVAFTQLANSHVDMPLRTVIKIPQHQAATFCMPAYISNSKQLSRAAMTTKIEEHDCGTDNGLTVEVDDKDSIGTFLAHPVGGYKKNNEVTAKMLNDLSNKGGFLSADIVRRRYLMCIVEAFYRIFIPRAMVARGRDGRPLRGSCC